MRKFLKRVIDVIVGVFTDLANIITGRGPALPPWDWKQETDPAAPGSNSDIDDLIKGYMRQHSVKAGQFSLFVNGALTMSSAYTWGEAGYPTTKTDSVMRVASCSKAFTTTAILDLLDPIAGFTTLRATDKVFDRLFPASGNRLQPSTVDEKVTEITVQHLLEHTGGWNYRTGPSAIGDWVFHMKDIARDAHLGGPPTKIDFAHHVLCNIRLDFDPGTRPVEYFTPPDFASTKAMDTYSNIGYVLLGMLVGERETAYIDHLKNITLAPLSITDVSVGKTREADRLPNEVFYESTGSGPDATRHPLDLTFAPLPYGGDGSLKEVMDSGGGLIMSANSLARFITRYNVLMTALDPNRTIAELKARQRAMGVGQDLTQTRYGRMPGTQAAASSFQVKGGSKLYDMAVIFNRDDVSKVDRGDNSDDFDRLVRHLQEKVRENF